MIDIETLKIEIIKRLKPLNPEKIILFGSYGYGTPTKDSDVDLYVVTNDDFIPQSFMDKMNVKLKVSNAIKDLKMRYDFDLIVHTKKMNENFAQMKSLFSDEILEKGKKIYG